MLKRCILNDNLYLFDLCKRYFHTNDQWWEGQQDDLVETIFWYDAINMYKAFVNRRLIPAKGNLSKAIERKSKAITIYLLNSTDEKVIYNIFAELDKQKKEKEIKFLADLLMKIGAENNNENFLDIAMTYDADLEKLKDNKGNNLIHQAMLAENWSRAQQLIKNRNLRSLIHQSNNQGWRPLHIAAWKGNTQTVGLLLQERTNVNAPGEKGWTALHYAVKEQNENMVRQLLRYRANTEIKDDQGITPYKMAKRLKLKGIRK